MFRKRNPPVASAPGAFTIDSQAAQPRIYAITYSLEALEESEIKDLDQLPASLHENAVTWIDVHGLGNETVLERLAEIFSLHRLALADVVNVPQRPKVEPYDDHLFLITRAATLEGTAHPKVEQVSIFLGRNYLLTFQERHGGALEPLRNRIRIGKDPIRGQGADYLAYAVLDAAIDGYYPVLESLGDHLAELEEEALDCPTKATVRKANQARNTLLTLRHVIWPQRDAINSLLRDPHPLVTDTVRIYLRDCHDHCLQISEVIDSYREVVGSITSTYLSSVSNRMNEIMKVLTIMASIFIPLTFMVGIYGMNFDYMPEIHFRHAYPILWILMAAVAVGMLLYFRRSGWIGSGDDED